VEAAGSDQSRKELARNRTRPAGMRARDVSTKGSLLGDRKRRQEKKREAEQKRKPQSARVVWPSRSVLARFRLHGTKPHQQSDGRWCAQTSACCSTRRKARERASTHTRPGSHSHIPLCHTQSASRSSEALSATSVDRGVGDDELQQQLLDVLHVLSGNRQRAQAIILAMASSPSTAIDPRHRKL